MYLNLNLRVHIHPYLVKDQVVVLSMNDCYNNLWLLYDKDNNKYSTLKEPNSN